MTRRETQIVLALSIAVALTRFLALSHSMWDWDEGLFSTALHDYNVALHHPHPPGFPLYVAAARLVRLVIHDDFRALRAVNLLASLFLFPAMAALARAMKFPFAIACSAGVLLAFLPNVWYYGGTAFSDELNLVLLIAGLALLFGDRFHLGTAVFALSILVRPQNVLCAYPWFVAAWRRRSAKRISIAAAIAIVIVAGGYGVAAYVTGWPSWLMAVRAHQHYVTTIDGFRNPDRPPAWTLFPPFALDPFEAGWRMLAVCIFAALAIVLPKRRDGDALATFGPNLLFVLFMLNPSGTSRLSLSYMPLHALLAADGIARVANGVAVLVRRPRAALAAQIVVVAALAGRLVSWCLVPLREVRRTDSPPVQAMKWVRQNIPVGSTLFIDGGYGPLANVYLRSYDAHLVDGEEDLAKIPPLRNAWYVADRNSKDPKAVNFRRPRKRLFALFTRRYFESSVQPMTGAVRYLDGWYDEEGNAAGDRWHWMGRRARVQLQAIAGGGELRFTAGVPLDAEAPPTVAVTIDGKVVDSFVAATRTFTRRYALPPSSAPHDVVFDVSNAVNPARRHLGGDTRDLGMQLTSISWTP
ncbi:MAG TPA: hypothetical protein VI670_03975 [Thermoanaerobaculia bacterium]|jgi:hypothetical protein